MAAGPGNQRQDRDSRAQQQLFAPLSGVRVLDVTTSIAGPWCTQILGALGADVIKVEAPTRGDETRRWGPPFWNEVSTAYLAANANKRSLAVDLKSEDGREAVLRVAETADVFVQNMRPGLAARLGLGFSEVRRRSPGVVYCSIGAFGSAGPLRDQPGYDPQMQAAGGIMSVTGEPGGPPVRAGVSIVDQGTALWAVIGILTALVRREAGDGAQLVDTSLYESALNWVPYHLLAYLATGRSPEPMGSALAMLAPYEAFETQSGWIVIAVGNDRQFAALCDVLGDPELADDPRFATNAARVSNRQALGERISAPLEKAPAATWAERLSEAGVPASPVNDIAQVAAHPQTQALGIIQSLPHAAIPDLEHVSPPLTVNGTRTRHSTAPPALGEHSVEVLAEVGYAREEIGRLRRAGVIAGEPVHAPAPGAGSAAREHEDATAGRRAGVARDVSQSRPARGGSAGRRRFP